jgi:hypothetical protein
MDPLELAALRLVLGELAAGDLPVPIQTGLAQEITLWAADYDSTSDDDPTLSGVITAEAAVTFVERGRRIVARLQEALGTSWNVEYMPEPVLHLG